MWAGRCNFCDETFITRKTTGKFCSRECYDRWRSPILSRTGAKAYDALHLLYARGSLDVLEIAEKLNSTHTSISKRLQHHITKGRVIVSLRLSKEGENFFHKHRRGV